MATKRAKVALSGTVRGRGRARRNGLMACWRLVGLREGWRRVCRETALGLLGFPKVVVLG
ncbi:hypothetical protein ES332_D02G183100v1 [Gossypium tomentosum]|uniref:Uncharacterized protein n=1 Tax=Gossypium tomentosum TaxID=34277 RepID=A0A5D2LYZ1_GOSTO|nr:hypothetical protein ES332_D02G183100v1 [Gossypium tomentosum]